MEISKEEILRELDRVSRDVQEKTDIWICWHYPLNTPKEMRDMGIQQYSWQRAILCLHEWDRKKVFYTLEEPYRSSGEIEIDHEIMRATKTIPNGVLDGDLEMWLRDEVSRFNVPFSEVREELQRALSDFEEIANGEISYPGGPKEDEVGWVTATKFNQPIPP